MENHSRIKAKNIVSKVLCFMKVKFERFKYEIDVETKHRGRMTQRTGPDWRPSQLSRGREAVICTVMEDLKIVPYWLLQQELLSCELLSISIADMQRMEGIQGPALCMPSLRKGGQLSPYLQTFKGAQKSIPSLAGRYGNPICRTGPPGYIGCRNRFLGIYSWAP